MERCAVRFALGRRLAHGGARTSVSHLGVSHTPPQRDGTPTAASDAAWDSFRRLDADRLRRAAADDGPAFMRSIAAIQAHPAPLVAAERCAMALSAVAAAGIPVAPDSLVNLITAASRAAPAVPTSIRISKLVVLMTSNLLARLANDPVAAPAVRSIKLGFLLKLVDRAAALNAPELVEPLADVFHAVAPHKAHAILARVRARGLDHAHAQASLNAALDPNSNTNPISLANAAAVVLGRSGRPEDAKNIACRTMDLGAAPQPVVWVSIVKAYLDRNEFELARMALAKIANKLSNFRSMDASEFTKADALRHDLTVKSTTQAVLCTWTLLIRYLFRMSDNPHKDVYPLIDNLLNHKRIIPDMKFFVTVIYGCRIHCDADRAHHYMHRISTKFRIKPSALAYCAYFATKIVASNGKLPNWNDIDTFLSLTQIPFIDCRSFAMLINAYLRVNDTDMALRVYRRMTAPVASGGFDLAPPPPIVHAFLNHYLHVGDTQAAFDIYSQMLSHGCRHNAYVYDVLLRLSVSDLEDLREFWSQTLGYTESRLVPAENTDCVTAVEAVLDRLQDKIDAKQSGEHVVNATSEKSDQIDKEDDSVQGSKSFDDTFQLDRVRQAIQHTSSCIDRADIDMDSDMEIDGDADTPSSAAPQQRRYPDLMPSYYSTIFISLLKNGHKAEAMSVLDTMKSQHMAPSLDMIISLAHCKHQAGENQAAIDILDRARIIAAHGYTGTNTTDIRIPLRLQRMFYTTLMASWAALGNLPETEHAMSEMLSQSIAPNTRVFNILGHAYAQANDLFNLCRIVMCAKACACDTATLTRLVSQLWTRVQSDKDAGIDTDTGVTETHLGEFMHRVSTDEDTIRLVACCQRLVESTLSSRSKRQSIAVDILSGLRLDS